MSRLIHCEVEDQNGRVFFCINCSLVVSINERSGKRKMGLWQVICTNDHVSNPKCMAFLGIAEMIERIRK